MPGPGSWSSFSARPGIGNQLEFLSYWEIVSDGTTLTTDQFLAIAQVLTPELVPLYQEIVPDLGVHEVRREPRWDLTLLTLYPIEIREEFTHYTTDGMRTEDSEVSQIPSVVPRLEVVAGDPLPGTDDFELGAAYAATESSPWLIQVNDDVGKPNDRWPEWQTRQALQDVLAHELGHIVMYVLQLRLGGEAVEEAVRGMFGAPDAEWDEGPWEDRLVEGFAETFKDVYLLDEERLFCNRTNHELKNDDTARIHFFELIDQMNAEYTVSSYGGWKIGDFDQSVESWPVELDEFGERVDPSVVMPTFPPPGTNQTSVYGQYEYQIPTELQMRDGEGSEPILSNSPSGSITLHSRFKVSSDGRPMFSSYGLYAEWDTGETVEDIRHYPGIPATTRMGFIPPLPEGVVANAGVTEDSWTLAIPPGATSLVITALISYFVGNFDDRFDHDWWVDPGFTQTVGPIKPDDFVRPTDWPICAKEEGLMGVGDKMLEGGRGSFLLGRVRSGRLISV